MGKGQAIITLLIIAVLVAGFLFLSPQVFRPSAVTEPVRFKNDIITLENFEISNLRPLQGSPVTVSFDVSNNGDKKVDKVYIDFGESTEGTFRGFVECGLQSDKPTKQKCTINNLESLESRKVKVAYQVVSDFNQNIVVKVNYAYSGTREALMPIIDDKTIKRPSSQFRQSEPSPGPFVVDVIPPTSGWAIADQPFEVKFKLRFIGSAAAGKTKPIEQLGIDRNNFRVKLTGLQAAGSSSGFLSCPQFKQDKGTTGEFRMVNSGEILANKEYSCALQAIDAQGNFGLKSGVIDVTYVYNFEFTKSQNIVVIKGESPARPIQACEDIKDRDDCQARSDCRVTALDESGICTRRQIPKETPGVAPTPAPTPSPTTIRIFGEYANRGQKCSDYCSSTGRTCESAPANTIDIVGGSVAAGGGCSSTVTYSCDYSPSGGQLCCKCTPTSAATPAPILPGTITLETLSKRLNKPIDDPDLLGFFKAIQATGGEQQALDKWRRKSINELFEKPYSANLDSWREFALCGEIFPGCVAGQKPSYCYKGNVITYPYKCDCPPGFSTEIGKGDRGEICKSFGTPVDVELKVTFSKQIKADGKDYQLIDAILLDPENIVVTGISSDDVKFETTLGELYEKTCFFSGVVFYSSCYVYIRSNTAGTATITGTYKNLKTTTQVQFVNP